MGACKANRKNAITKHCQLYVSLEYKSSFKTALQSNEQFAIILQIATVKLYTSTYMRVTNVRINTFDLVQTKVPSETNTTLQSISIYSCGLWSICYYLRLLPVIAKMVFFHHIKKNLRHFFCSPCVELFCHFGNQFSTSCYSTRFWTHSCLCCPISTTHSWLEM